MNIEQRISKLARQLLLILWPLLIPFSVMADEAEIFYQADAAKVNTNILFVLDASGSMDQPVPGSGGKSRMQVMQETFRRVVEKAPENLNVGLINYANADFNSNYQWSSVKGVGFPVSPIDDQAISIIGAHAATDNLLDATPGQPVRSFLADVVDSWQPRGFTPVVDSLYEAARYFRGENSVWGNYPAAYTWAAHPATYTGNVACDSPSQQECRLEWGECNGSQNSCASRPISSCCDWDAAGGFCRDNDYSCSVDVTHCQHTVCAGTSGNTTYKSPIEYSCQPSFMVLMSDGKPQYPYSNRGTADGTQQYPESAFPDRAHDSTVLALQPAVTGGQVPEPIPAMIGSNCVDQPSGFGSGTCGPELTRFLAAEDQSSALEGEQTVETFTVAFGMAAEPQGTAYLASLATADEGAYTANNSEELAEVLENVLGKIDKKSYSFSSPSFSISEDSLLANGQDVYVPVFSSSRTAVWSGNLRKLRLSSNNRLVGAANREVLTDSGQFMDNAQDLWSALPHGGDAAAGGAASRLPAPEDRVLKTDAVGNVMVDLDSSVPDSVITPELMSSGIRRTRHGLLDFVVEATGESGADGLSRVGWYTDCDGSRVRVGTLLKPAATPVNIKQVTTCPGTMISKEQRSKALDFARGYDVTDTGEIDRASSRKHIGDILNSKPVVVNYASKSLVLVATNEGYLHAFNADTGVEEWAFMPSSLLKNQLAFMDSKEKNQHVYGLDGALTLWNYDANKDGEISRSSDGRDRRMLYFGMRRGGDMYYALDITNPASPTVSWKISPHSRPGATTFGFSGLGETWSKPTLSKMRVASKGGSASEVKHVLVFGGGYDPKYDEYQRSARASGTARGADVFIVDAQSGALLWSAKREGGAAADGLTHSVASDIRVLDMDNNGELDRLYFADLGGNVWRSDLSLDVASTGGGARFSSKTALTKLASLGDAPGGDGDHRKFFYEPDTALRMSNGEPVMTVSLGSGYRSHPLDQGDQDRFYVLLDRDVYRARDASAAAIITHADLKTAATDGSGFGGSILDFPDQDGWYINLSHNAEKVLAGSVTFLDKVLFTTFAHADASGMSRGVGPCSPLETSARAYVLDVMTGKAVADLERVGAAGPSGGGSPGRHTPFMVAGGTGEILDAPQLIFSQLSSSAGGDCSAGSCQQSVSVRVGKLDVPLLDLENTANDEGSSYSEMVDLTKILPRLYWRDGEVIID